MLIRPRLFSHDSVLPLDQFVLSTEAHPVPILGKGADKGAHTFAHISIPCCWCKHVQIDPNVFSSDFHHP